MFLFLFKKTGSGDSTSLCKVTAKIIISFYTTSPRQILRSVHIKNLHKIVFKCFSDINLTKSTERKKLTKKLWSKTSKGKAYDYNEHDGFKWKLSKNRLTCMPGDWYSIWLGMFLHLNWAWEDIISLALSLQGNTENSVIINFNSCPTTRFPSHCNTCTLAQDLKTVKIQLSNSSPHF